MLKKTICVILCAITLFAPLTLVCFAKIEYENVPLKESRINALPYNAKIIARVDNAPDTCVEYVGFNVLPPTETFTSDSAIQLALSKVSMGSKSPYYYYGITNLTRLMFYREASFRRYITEFYVPPTICLKTDLLTLPLLYVAIKDTTPYCDIGVNGSVYDTERNYVELFAVTNPYDELMNEDDNAPSYCTISYTNSTWYCYVNIGKLVYDSLPQYDDNSLISFSCRMNHTEYCNASGLVTYLTDYSSRIYNTTGNYFNERFAITGYKGVGGFVSSLLGGFHRIMSTNILPHLSLYTILITATAIPTTIAILRKL